MSSARRTRSGDQRRERFIRFYAEGLSGSAAAIKAGYSAKGAHVAANRLLRNATVRARIDAINSAATEAAGIDRARTLREVARVAYSDVRKLLDAEGKLKPIHTLTEEEAAQIAGIDVETITTETKGKDGENSPAVSTTTVKKIKRWDKNRALEMCINVLGLNKPVDPAGTGGGLSVTIVPYDAKNRLTIVPHNANHKPRTTTREPTDE